MAFNNFPYTNFQDLNLGWIMNNVKIAVSNSVEAVSAAEELKQFVNTYFNNLDVQEEINNKIDSLVASGQIEDMVGAVAPAIITAWMNANITPTTPVVDKTLSIDGAAADALKTGNIKSDLSSVKKELFRVNAFDGEWQQGAYASADGTFVNRNDYISTVNPIYIKDSVGLIAENYNSPITGQYYFLFWDENDNFLGSKQFGVIDKYEIDDEQYRDYYEAAYMHISVTNGYGINTNISNAPSLKVYVNHFGLTTKEVYENSLRSYGVSLLNWQNYIYYFGQQGQKAFINNRIGIVEPIKARRNMTISIDSTDYKFAVLFFSSEELGVANEIRATSWTDEPVNVRAGDIFLINMRKTDQSAITPEAGEHIIIDHENVGYNNYAIGSDLVRKPLRVTNIGALRYYQSFCIYDGKFYSTNGTNIAEQDASLTVLRDVAANVGHGNSMQLGSNGVAYVSGWDDDKVYIVNLTTLTVTGTITLPVGAYQTTAIDDVNHIAYIFYRNTSPASIGKYEFIVYNYNTETIISRKNVSVEFAAMQALDLYEDRIIVLNGMASETAPNGFRIYDLNGNIIGNWVINTLGNLEPEGVAVDRETGIVYISDVNTGLYTVE